MTALRAILIEDEPSGMDNLRWKLQQHCPEVEIVAECGSGKEGIAAIREQLPDLIFLDILLGDMTGFDVLKEFPFPNFEVIITTSYDSYAIEAIKRSASYYLLKPVEVMELMQAVTKVRMKLPQRTPPPPPPPPATITRMAFPVPTGQHFIDLIDIVYAEAEDNVALLHLIDKRTIRLTRPLGWVEEELEPHNFCRVHNSYVINLRRMTEYIRNDGGYVVMEGGKGISISRRRKDHFIDLLNQFYHDDPANDAND